MSLYTYFDIHFILSVSLYSSYSIVFFEKNSISQIQSSENRKFFREANQRIDPNCLLQINENIAEIFSDLILSIFQITIDRKIESSICSTIILPSVCFRFLCSTLWCSYNPAIGVRPDLWLCMSLSLTHSVPKWISAWMYSFL